MSFREKLLKANSQKSRSKHHELKGCFIIILLIIYFLVNKAHVDKWAVKGRSISWGIIVIELYNVVEFFPMSKVYYFYDIVLFIIRGTEYWKCLRELANIQFQSIDFQWIKFLHLRLQRFVYLSTTNFENN